MKQFRLGAVDGFIKIFIVDSDTGLPFVDAAGNLLPLKVRYEVPAKGIENVLTVEGSTEIPLDSSAIDEFKVTLLEVPAGYEAPDAIITTVDKEKPEHLITFNLVKSSELLVYGGIAAAAVLAAVGGYLLLS